MTMNFTAGKWWFPDIFTNRRTKKPGRCTSRAFRVKKEKE